MSDIAQTTTRTTARQEISKLDHSYASGTTTTNLTTSTALADTKLTAIGYHNNSSLLDAWVWINTTNNALIEKTIAAYTGSTGAITVRGPVFAAESATAAYEIHKRFRPSDIHDAINRSVQENYDVIFKEVENTTLFTSTGQRVYPVPTGVNDVWGVYLENRVSAEFDQNILHDAGASVEFSSWAVSTYPDGSDAATNITLSQYGTTGQQEKFTPFGQYLCKCVSAGSAGTHYWTTMSNPADFGGITTYYEEPIYCTTASEVQVRIVDDQGNTTSTAHGGTGLELVRVKHTTTGVPTSLQAGIVTAGNGVTFYRGRAIWTRAEYYTDSVWIPLEVGSVYNGNIHLGSQPPVDRFLLVRGKAPLSTLSTDTGTIEVGDPQVQIIYAGALLHLYRQLRQKGTQRSNNPYNEDVLYWEGELHRLKNRYGMGRPPARTPALQGRA